MARKGTRKRRSKDASPEHSGNFAMHQGMVMLRHSSAASPQDHSERRAKSRNAAKRFAIQLGS